MNTLIKSFVTLAGFFIFCACANGQSKYPVCGPQVQFFSKDSINITTFGASTVQGNPAALNFQNSLKDYLQIATKARLLILVIMVLEAKLLVMVWHVLMLLSQGKQVSY